MSFNDHVLTVMTWNLYLGARIDPVLKVGFHDPEALASTASDVWDEVLANDFQDRAMAIVDGIQATMPDLVGFQELARFRSWISDPASDSTIPDKTLDFQTILEGELQTRRLPYSFAACIENTRAGAPIAGFGDQGRFVPTRRVELTLRDAILVKDTVRVDGVSRGRYRAGVPLGLDAFGSEIRMNRGWIRVEAEVGGFPIQFVNTHLETQTYFPVQLGQTRELLTEVVPGPDVATILVGDFNSDAAASPGERSWTSSYQEIIDAGFLDTWAASHHPDGANGCTCSDSSDLGDLSSDLDQRIDFVFIRGFGRVRSGTGEGPGLTSEVIGRGPKGTRSPGDRWPSDHAGLLTRFRRLPP